MRYEEFDPRLEYEALNIAPRDNKIERERDFERRRREQRIGIATAGGLAIETVLSNPETPKQELLGIFDEYREELKLADYQRALARDIINAYCTQHELVKGLYGAEEDDFSRLRRLLPQIQDARSVAITPRPISLHVRLDGRAYRLIRGSGNSSGFFRPSLKDFTFECAEAFRGEGTMLHEEQHAIYYLLRTQAEKKLGKSLFNRPTPNLGEIVRRSPHEGEHRVVADYIQRLVAAEGDRIKNEIFAFTRTSDIAPTKVLKYLTAEDEGYDYWKNARSELLEYLSRGRSQSEVAKTVESARLEFKQARLRLTGDGLEAVKALKTRLGFNHWQAVLLLFDRPLERWSEEVAKLSNSTAEK
ncbi:MAG: hypothetical protein PHT12_02025 [Patescibacteria group bacterium]|nr:hypothetical protein [Patescibacteria group bacterium]